MPPNLGRFSKSKRQNKDSFFQRQYLWNVPEGNRPDFSDIYSHGENIPISWNALNNSIYDLWITSWNWDVHPVALCLARSVNLAHDGALNLINPNPPSEFFVNKTRYVLRFKPPTPEGKYVPLDPEIVSPGFFIVSPSEKSGKSVTTGISSSSSSPTPPILATIQEIAATEAPSSSQSTNAQHGIMSTGAAAGLTIGLVLSVSLLVCFIVGALHMRRRGQAKQQSEPEITTIALPEKVCAMSRSKRRRDRLAKWPRRMLPLDRIRPKRIVSGKSSDGKERGLFVSVESKSPVLEVEFSTPWRTSPELPRDEGWIVYELYGGGREDDPVELPAESRPRYRESE
ncbi:hypothetical protein QBC43DRAFT_312702 [Cladorrhinum sp. PSN259]|nr:hypothetical protein QBC43DRAFT_312702 [Cladorrhinum sp. PSN259]